MKLIKQENMSFEEQQNIKKVLLTEAGGDSASEYESDREDPMVVPESSRKEGDMVGEYSKRNDRIFKYIRVQDKSVRIPDLEKGHEDKLTLFMEIDDVLLYTYICDQNFGYLANPTAKDPEHEFFLEEIRQPVVVYMRDNWQEFMNFLKDSKDWLDVVVYTTALQPYTEKLVEILDPKREVLNNFVY